MLVGGLLAFCMEVAEFMVVTFSSSLTLAIVGVVKVSISMLQTVSKIWSENEKANNPEIKDVIFFGLNIAIVSCWARSLRIIFKDFLKKFNYRKLPFLS